MKKFWLNLPIRFKILSYYLVIVILLFIALSIFSRNNTKVLGLLNENIDNNYKIYVAMEKSNQDLKDMERYLFHNDTAALESYNERQENLDHLIDDLSSTQSSLETYFTIRAIYYSTKAYKEYFNESVIKKQANDELYYLDYYKATDIKKYTDRYFNDLLLENSKNELQKAESIKEETNRIKRTTYNFILIIGSLAFVLGLFLSNYIVKPIKTLSEYSKNISKGNLEIQEVDVDSNDEIGDLSNAYSHMAKSIKEYVERIKEKANIEKKLHEEERAVMQMEQLLQQARVEALQAKINPHFLFNTLNAVSRTAYFEEAYETMDLIQMLSKIFRYQLKSAGEKVTLDEEKKLVTDYLKLQSVRFKERLKYEIDIPLNIDVYIPVLILQPLVENAIDHGFASRIEGGTIKIRAYESPEKVVIEVSDNGVGMNKELVDKINSNETLKTKNRASLGISNVRDRFLLAYTEKSQFIVESEKNKGTTIKMIIFKEGGQIDV
ncbi:MAG: histidine kinase [Eubacteriales bacterium]